MRLAVAALLLSASAAWGQALPVRSGEHPGFTRIAFDIPDGSDWQFGRSAKGYALRLEGGAEFDLSRVWRSMGRSRIAALRAEDGTLVIDLGCDCHAVPLRVGARTLAIDVRNGAAPDGSRFETALAGPELAGPEPVKPQPRPAPVVAPAYDWRSLPRPERHFPAPAALDPFRDALIRQLSEGASRGVVEMALPAAPPVEQPLPPHPQLRVAEEPGFIRDPEAPLTDEGVECIPATSVALPDWGSDLPVPEALATMRSGLVAEFDRPEPEAVIRAARYMLHLGFGAEARQIARLAAIPERATMEAMARILDGREPGTAFASMAGCDSPVALWAILSLPEPQQGRPENTPAALQAFAALPAHLKPTLGPMLIARFEARHDATSVRVVREAMLRATSTPDPAVRLLTATLDDDGRAVETLVAEGGTQSNEALIVLARSRLAGRQPLDPATLTGIEALLRERRGGPQEGELRRIVAEGRASATDFSDAFEMLRDAPEAAPAVWGWLARTGGDDALLRHAVIAADATHPDADDETRQTIAERLIALGLPAPARGWLAKGNALRDAPPAERLLAARAMAESGEGLTALSLVSDLGAEADDLRGSVAGPVIAPPPMPEPAAPLPALARSRALVAGADETRARIAALLGNGPEGNRP